MPISFVIAFSLISATAYAQEQNQTMNKSNKYFAIQNTKTSIPDNVGPEHQQYHQIAIALPPQGNKIYIGQVSYSASTPVNVFVALIHLKLVVELILLMMILILRI